MGIKFVPPHLLKLMDKKDREGLGAAGLTQEEINQRNEILRERELHDQVENLLRLHQVTFRHDRMDKKTTGTVGWPDFTFCWLGNPVAIECKAPGGFLSQEQSSIINGMKKDGWKVKVAHSLTEVRDFLWKLQKLN